MTLRIAITRTLPEAERTALRVRARGHDAVLAPLLWAFPALGNRDVTGVQALLFTSPRGVSVFAQMSPYRNLPALTVGDATADWARAAGFADVRSANGDVAALGALAISTLDPAAGRVLHLSGDRVAGDLVGDLRAAGFAAERRTAYIVSAVEELPPAFSAPLDIVLFHSARAAETFLALGAPGAERLVAGCISPAVAEAAAKTAWREIVVAPAPREDALLSAILRV